VGESVGGAVALGSWEGERVAKAECESAALGEGCAVALREGRGEAVRGGETVPTAEVVRETLTEALVEDEGAEEAVAVLAAVLEGGCDGEAVALLESRAVLVEQAVPSAEAEREALAETLAVALPVSSQHEALLAAPASE
jgi:hypothetical protein